MNTYYSGERNIQMLIYLMKQHEIKKIVVSPGATNVTFVASIQNDPYFTIYSCVDERSAAYMACGLAAESGEPVSLSCTGATASRNYLSGLTEAFYRKLPILAITATQHLGRLGQNIPQTIDRRTPLNDIVKMSVQIPKIHDSEDEWSYGVMLNDALLELRHRGGGPVHINIATDYNADYSVKEISPVKVIHRVSYGDVFPDIMAGRVAIFVGAHLTWSDELTNSVDTFCEKYNGVVLCDQTSNYHGKYCVFPNLVCGQDLYSTPYASPDLMIHIGDVSGAYLNVAPKNVWRVNPDGMVRDTFRKLNNVFEMEECAFFENYNSQVIKIKTTEYYNAWIKECKKVEEKIPELPFSNIWIAQQTLSKLPEGCVLHLGILNSLRAWNMFKGSDAIQCFCNTGGFGIDGCTSSLVGASLSNPKKLYFGVVGDLSFFYDMNSIGNRHLGNNIRLMVVNNGKGTEFRNYNHSAAIFDDETDIFIAAAGHFGNKSRDLLRHYSEDLGFEYLTASSKEEYLDLIEKYVNPNITERPILFEVFTNSDDENNALKVINSIEKSSDTVVKKQTKQLVRNIIGEKNYRKAKNFLNK